jgi:hypothetical protein
MAIAKHTLLTMPPLLTITVALASTTMVEAAAHHWLQLLPRLDDDNTAGAPPRIHGPLGQLVLLSPVVVACWKSILASDSYVDDILQSLARLEVHVSKVCYSP